MSRRHILVAAACLAIGIIATAYIAGVAFFILNKAVPKGIEIDTWLRFWDGYSADPVQHRRLLLAAGTVATVVIGIPLLAIAVIGRGARSLHGDARWANASEIRKAGLL